MFCQSMLNHWQRQPGSHIFKDKMQCVPIVKSSYRQLMFFDFLWSCMSSGLQRCSPIFGPANYAVARSVAFEKYEAAKPTVINLVGNMHYRLHICKISTENRAEEIVPRSV